MKILLPKLVLFKKLSKVVEIEALIPEKKLNNPELIEDLIFDIKKNGLLCPLVIDENNRVVDGNHRYHAIKNDYTHTLVYKILYDKAEDEFLSKLNSRLWLDTHE
tara:strand:- start:478 stop:792 length:315 start_codon:yes stop_codon:yes gene_type:complete